ncbi:MAG TPA: 4-hydroxyphenylpyruvate dioxygenase [Longimicrobium sp.]|nr:4-hydroxyphenylpyruvate dioxygenase [Longimicrobium sp.]
MSANADTGARGAVQIQAIDHIELYVGNAFQAAHFYRTAFGFTPTAYAGLETGVRDRTSYVVEQGRVRLVLTSPIGPEGPVGEHVHRHGDGVRDVAFTVPDARRAFELAVSRGARAVREPEAREDEHGVVVTATIGAFGDSLHTFVERGRYTGVFTPGFRPLSGMPAAVPVGITEVDHVAVGMEAGKLDDWVDFYIEVLGFHQSHEEMVFTERSRMNSKVVSDDSGAVKFPIVEPKEAKGMSQIDEYLNFHGGAGTQHVAFGCEDVCAAVEAVRAQGVDFVQTPGAYYDLLEARVGAIDPVEMERLRADGILVDRDEHGRLLQIFSKPITGRPTMFVELIERRGARGFGGGNIHALFEAVEREQALRGTL